MIIWYLFFIKRPLLDIGTFGMIKKRESVYFNFTKYDIIFCSFRLSNTMYWMAANHVCGI